MQPTQVRSQLTVVVNPAQLAAIAKILGEAPTLETAPATTTTSTTPTTTTAPAKRTRKPKETEEQFNLSNDDGPGERGANGDRSLDEMDAEEQAETEAEVTETAEDEQPELSLSDVVRAFKDYAKTNGREKALKILAKYKVKSVQDLKKSQYAQVLETLEG